MAPKELEQHTQNDLCKEKFRVVEDYMTSGKAFRDTVLVNAHQIITLEKTYMELKDSIEKVDKKVDNLATAINSLSVEISKMVASIPDSDIIKNFEARLKSLELWRWFLLGGFAVLMFIIEKLWK